MSEGRIIHCPNCGAALMVIPDVASTRVATDRVLVEFKSEFVEHQCWEYPDE